MIGLARLNRRDHLAPLLTAAVLAAILIGLAIWLWPTGPVAPAAERVIQVVNIEPPLPPPPEPEKPIEEEIVEIRDTVVPVEQPKQTQDKPSETPSEAPAAPSVQPAGLDRPADAGSDSFRLAAGRGGGLFGRGGGGSGDWEAAVAMHITRALQRDSRTRTARGRVRVGVTIEADGGFSSARLASSTGDPKLDADIRNVLSKLLPMGRPRPVGVSGSTNLMINLTRTGG
jgi:TonB family protein